MSAAVLNSVLRPPGALPEKKFLSLCVQCGQCAQVCPYGSISMAGGAAGRHSPLIDPRVSPCWLCMKCPPQCPTGALDTALDQATAVRMGRALILEKYCYNFTGGVMCWTCYDRCPLRGSAIVLQHGITPTISDNCVGCGVCAYVCPVQAVHIVPAAAEEKKHGH